MIGRLSNNNFNDQTTNSNITDLDEDTYVEVENSSDEDVVRVFTAGTERANISASGVNVAGDLVVSGTITGVEDPFPITFMLMGA